MIGSVSATAAVTPGPAGQVPVPVVGNGAKSAGSTTTTGASAWVLLFVFGGIFLLIAAIQDHQKVREAVKPENIKANLHNMLIIFLAVCLPLMTVSCGSRA